MLLLFNVLHFKGRTPSAIAVDGRTADEGYHIQCLCICCSNVQHLYWEMALDAQKEAGVMGPRCALL
uniref:Uncharacterized protein n=1 Tax=Anguilla anguilla TaxID=7936 RepID=A0A0E9WQ32_ANGAN